ncbi:MAG: 6-pyruvoyl trahydropterin synthase family protein [Phycisphaeraceae bacterium]
MYEIAIERTFTASHALRLPGGEMEPAHEHDWRVTLRIAASELDEIETVMDFHELERLLEAAIGPWRGTHLNEIPPFDSEVNPSAERVAERIGRTIQPELPERVRLISASVTEAPGCEAWWRPEP